MTVDLAALAKLASEATPGPWRAGIEQPEDPVVWGPNDTWIANVGQWGANPTPDSVACADALFVAAASPDVVLALVRVALAAQAYLNRPLRYMWTNNDVMQGENPHLDDEKNELIAALADLDA